MPFNSYPYFVFLAVGVLGFRLLEQGAPTGRRVFLLLASYGFYAWWRADFLALLCGSTLVNYALGCEIERRRMQHKDRRAILVAGLVFNLGLIATFKYDTLFVSTANDVLGIGLAVPHFFLPLAISFFTFEQISYLVDADAGKTHTHCYGERQHGERGEAAAQDERVGNEGEREQGDRLDHHRAIRLFRESPFPEV